MIEGTVAAVFLQEIDEIVFKSFTPVVPNVVVEFETSRQKRAHKTWRPPASSWFKNHFEPYTHFVMLGLIVFTGVLYTVMMRDEDLAPCKTEVADCDTWKHCEVDYRKKNPFVYTPPYPTSVVNVTSPHTPLPQTLINATVAAVNATAAAVNATFANMTNATNGTGV